jgi:multicomponent Na+:H+ antiporter subunit C
MSVLPLTVAMLVAGGVYLLCQVGMIRIIFGITLLSHAANLVLLAAGVSAWRGEPISGTADAASSADPLPQAFVLTAIVITLAVTVFMLALAAIGNDDNTQHLPETGQDHEA